MSDSAERRASFDAADLRGLLQATYDKPGVHVIDVAVDYSENDRIFNREIQARSALV